MTMMPGFRHSEELGRWVQALQVVVLVSVIMFIGRDIFIPISFAALISFILYPACHWLERKGLGKVTAILIALTSLLALGVILAALVFFQFKAFLGEWPEVRLKLTEAVARFSTFLIDSFGVETTAQRAWLNRVLEGSGSNVFDFLANAISFSAFSAVMLVLVPVYAVLILYYRQYWLSILFRIFPKERSEGIREMLHLTITTYYNFIKGMGIVYLCVGILNSVGLLILGVPHAILFGFIASVLTFIPYAGIIVGAMLPMAVSWLAFDSVWYPIGVVGIFTLVQYLEANIIFPLAVSSRLNINTLVMLMSIFIGGILWGVAGMILFVPFTGIAKLIADHNPKWKTVSMILGQPEKS